MMPRAVRVAGALGLIGWGIAVVANVVSAENDKGDGLTLVPRRADQDNPDGCYSALDLVQLQDATTSFDNVWDSMAKQVPVVLKAVKESHPESRFGLVVFGDKPLTPLDPAVDEQAGLGYSHDFCINELMPLQPVDEKKTVNTILSIRNIVSGGGADWAESQFEALFRVAISTTLGWGTRVDAAWIPKELRRFSRSVGDGQRNATEQQIASRLRRRLQGSPALQAKLANSTDPQSGPRLVPPAVRSRSKVIMLVTDSIPHVEGDVLKITGRSVPKFSLTTDEVSQYGPNYKCDAMDYPSTSIVLSKLRELNIHLFVLAAPAGTSATGMFQPYRPIGELSSRYEYENNTRLWYADTFSQHGVSVFVSQLDPACEAYAAAATKLLDNFLSWRCAVTTTETPPGTTTVATTPAPTVTTPSMPMAMALMAKTDSTSTTLSSTTPASSCPVLPGDACPSPSANCCCVNHCCHTCGNLQAQFKVNAVLGFNSRAYINDVYNLTSNPSEAQATSTPKSALVETMQYEESKISLH